METTTKKISIDEPKTATKNTFYDIKTLNNKIIYLNKKRLLAEAKMIKNGTNQSVISLLMNSYDKEMLFYVEKRAEIKLNNEIERVNNLF